jgi:hypothetical protein
MEVRSIDDRLLSDITRAARTLHGHAFPFPQPEYYFIYPHLDTRALWIIDNIHIPVFMTCFASFGPMKCSVCSTSSTEPRSFSEVPVFDPLGDGWWLQQYNRRARLRFTWTIS